jgi:hypothetical protein
MPVGEPFPVTQFAGPAETIPTRLSLLGLAVAHDRIIVPVVEASGNVWVLEGIGK